MSGGYDVSSKFGVTIMDPRLISKIETPIEKKPKPTGPKDLTGVNTKLIAYLVSVICSNWSQLK